MLQTASIEYYTRTTFAMITNISLVAEEGAGPTGHAVQGVGLRQLACWDCGFESRRSHGCLSLVSVVYCQVGVSAMSWSLVHRSPTDCGALLYEI